MKTKKHYLLLNLFIVIGLLAVLGFQTQVLAQDGFVIDNGPFQLRFSDYLELSIYKNGRQITANAAAFQIEVNGILIDKFKLKEHHKESIVGQFGNGERIIILAEADSLELSLNIDLYDNYPYTFLARAKFTNISQKELQVDKVWSVNLLLDRSLTSANSNSYDFKMLSMGTVYGNGLSDRIWDITADSNFINYNGGDVSNPEFDGHWGGGGTPITTVWGAEAAFTVAVVEANIQILAVPVETQKNGLVRLSVIETNDLPRLEPRQSFTTVQSSISLHNGDFYDGVEVYGRMLRDLGLLIRQYNPVDYEAHWDSFGLEERAGGLNPGDWGEVDERLYIAKDLGLKWLAIDSGWDNGTGSCSPNSEIYANEAEFIDWIADLHAQGFKVSLWLDPGFGDEKLLAKHPDWFIKNKDGSFFQDDWERFIMDPTVSEALDYVSDCVTKLVKPQAEGGWGIDRFFLDGAFLVPPDYSNRHDSPHDTEREGDAFYRVSYIAARAIVPDFPLEFCPCGGVITVWIAPYFSMVSSSDPDVLAYRPHEVRTKLYKALLGPDAAVNGDHIEGAGEDLNLDMNYMFPLILGLGDIYQSYYWETQWRKNDPLGVGDLELYKTWFGLYDELRLSQGNYLNLYDLAYDKPGSHAISKDGSIYYLFAPPYGESFNGEIEIRGLESGKIYDVLDYENDIAWGEISKETAIFNVRISANDPLLLKVTAR